MSVFSSSFFSFLAGFLGAGLVARFGSKFRFMDEAKERSSHTGSIPKGGGIGILLAFWCAGIGGGISWGLVAGGSVASLISLVGDKVDLSAGLRLLIHGCCALMLLTGMEETALIKNHPVLWLPAAVFVVGSANIYNFMDGINGIAGMTCVVAFGFMAFFLSQTPGGDAYVRLSLAMACSALAFLFFNVPNARVFMGDVGSILIGFVFSAMVLITAETLTGFFCMAGFALLFFLDEIDTMILRARLSESFFKAHRRHIYQILVNEMGHAHWHIALGYATAQAMICVCLIKACNRGLPAVLGVFLICAAAFFLFARRIRRKAVGI